MVKAASLILVKIQDYLYPITEAENDFGHWRRFGYNTGSFARGGPVKNGRI
jgi:hypothetical protein